MFYKLWISGLFVERVRKLYSSDIEIALSSVEGKFYKGKDQRTIKFVSRMNENLKSRR